MKFVVDAHLPSSLAVLVRTGNIGTRELKAIFTRNLPAILAALHSHTLVEIDRDAVTPVR